MAKVWCYVLDTDGITGITATDGSVVNNPLLYHIYECEDDNVEVGSTAEKKLYYGNNGLIDAQDLQNAVDAYTPAVPPLARTTAKKPAAKKPAAKKEKVTKPKTANAEYETKDTAPKG